MRKRLGSLLLAVSLSMGMVVSPFSSVGINVTKAEGENKILLAMVKEDGSVHFRISEPFESETDITSLVKITEVGGDEIKITSAKGNGRKCDVIIEGKLELGHSYTVAMEGYEEPMVIDMSGLFSTPEFEELTTYTGDDLGVTYTKEKTTFKVWSPTAQSMKINLYESGDYKQEDLITSYEMTKGDKSVWSVDVEEDLLGKYYTVVVNNTGKDIETQDPYAKAVGLDGFRCMVVDLDSTDPEGWSDDKRCTVKNVTDAIIYELHVRDFSVGEQSGVKPENVGKYLAFTEEGTKTNGGTSTGMDHIADLGVNMVHILPSYDFGSVNEAKGGYNWGYDPKNYQVPEGSYSSDPYKGEVRINEYKQMVKAFHDRGIGVIQDCVYNHTFNLSFSYAQLVPGYYHRANSNGSGCGNDAASERSMVRKYIVDSVVYWAEEYHLDGFRFDLMGLHDVDTMMAVRKAVDEIDPSILIYGEGWTMGTQVTKKDILMCTQKNASATEGIAYFSDGIRDYVINASFGSGGKNPGYANGSATTSAENLKPYIQGRYTSNAQDPSKSPAQVINYITCHDGFTLWDKINTSNKDDSEEDKQKQARLAEAIILTSQGIPFILSGDEFLRTKNFVDNSYNSGDEVNALNYELIEQNTQMYDYMKGLIKFRKNHAALRYTTFEEMDSTYTWLTDSQSLDKAILAYTIKGGTNGEVADNLLIAYNPTAQDAKLTLPEGDWQVCINGEKAGTDVIETVSGELNLTARSCFALVQGKTEDADALKQDTQDDSTSSADSTGSTSSSSTGSTSVSNDNESKSAFPVVPVIVVVVIVICGIAFVASKKQ